MKTRNGFVSNSSSSSFVCSICGESESGWDLGLSDFEMFECENGHCSHISCAKAEGDDFDDALADDCYEMDPKFCPICQLDTILPEDEVLFLRKRLGVTSKDVQLEIKKGYEDYKSFKNDIK